MTKRMTKKDILLKFMWDGDGFFDIVTDSFHLLGYEFYSKKDISNALYQLKKDGFIDSVVRGEYSLTKYGANYCDKHFTHNDDLYDDEDDSYDDEDEEQPIYDDEDGDEDMNQQNDSMINISKWTEIANHYASIAQHFAEIAKLYLKI